MADELLSIADFAIVQVLGRDHETATRIHTAIGGKDLLVLGNVSNPDALKDAVRAEAEAGRTVVVHVPHSHAKIRRDLSRIAHGAGAMSVAILVDAADELDAATEKHDAFYKFPASGSDIQVIRTRMPNDLRHLEGPFDFIGDIHGCADELGDLLVLLGHASHTGSGELVLRPHPEGRKVALVGDLTDRGPQNLEALRIAHRLHAEFGALAVLGNHDFKLLRWLRGSNVRVAAGLARTIEELEAISQDERNLFRDWLGDLQTHYALDGGRLVIAHAGLAEQFHGRRSKAADAFAMFGDKAGPVDEAGIPVLNDWAQTYSGVATVVHGHIVTPEPRVLNNVVSIDTGCVFGGALTAYRYPERDFVSVPARAVHFEADGTRTLV